MFDRYSDDARQVLFFARYQASLLGSPTLETEHLWMGLIQQNKKLMRRLAPGLTPELLASRLEGRGLTAERTSMTTEIPLSESLKLAFANAVALADAHHQKFITPQSLALGLQQAEESAAASSTM